MLVGHFLNWTISFGVQLRIEQRRSSVTNVMFLFFFKESKVLLSIPCFNN